MVQDIHSEKRIFILNNSTDLLKRNGNSNFNIWKEKWLDQINGKNVWLASSLKTTKIGDSSEPGCRSRSIHRSKQSLSLVTPSQQTHRHTHTHTHTFLCLSLFGTFPPSLLFALPLDKLPFPTQDPLREKLQFTMCEAWAISQPLQASLSSW